MTQRVFDIENEKDMEDLWDILPEEVYEIRRGYGDSIEDNTFFFKKGYTSTFLFNINWHDKTEIIRPVNYEDMIGCVGWFWGDYEEEKSLGILTEYKPEIEFHFVKGNNDCVYSHFRPAKKSELKFWEDKE